MGAEDIRTDKMTLLPQGPLCAGGEHPRKQLQTPTPRSSARCSQPGREHHEPQ